MITSRTVITLCYSIFTLFLQEGLIISTTLVAKWKTFLLFSLKRNKIPPLSPRRPSFRHSHLSIRSVAVSTFELASQSFPTTAPPLSKLKKRNFRKSKITHFTHDYPSLDLRECWLAGHSIFIPLILAFLSRTAGGGGGCLSPKTQVRT